MADKFKAEIPAKGTLFQHHGGFPARVVADDGAVIALFTDAEHAKQYASSLSTHSQKKSEHATGSE